MNLAIIGTGMIVQDFLTFINELPINKTYLLSTDRSYDKAKDFKLKYNLDKIYTDYEQLLNSDVDTVYIATPNHLHYALAKKALEHNKNVIVEKPITTNIEELIILESIANTNNIILLEAVNIHFLPAFISLKDSIKTLGNIKLSSFNYSQYSSRYDSFKKGIILPVFDINKAGGALMDINIYNLHAIISLFGYPLSANYLANIEQMIDTSGLVSLKYNQMVVSAVGAKDCNSPIVSTIQGDKASIYINQSINTLSEYKVITKDKKEIVYQYPEDKHRMYYEFVAFIDIIDNKNFTKSKELLNISKQVSTLMTLMRLENSIIFSSDLKKK